MSESQSLSAVLSDIYEASCAPGHWRAALASIARFTHSNSAIYLNRDNELDQVNSLEYYNIPKASIDAYNEYGHDPNFAIMIENVPIGVAAAIDHLVPDRKALERVYGETFTEILSASDRPYTAGVIIFYDSVRTVAVAVQRKRSWGPWEKDEIERLNELVPHLRRSLTIQKQFARLRIREQALKKGLDRLAMGLILFDKKLQPVYVNPVAESILQEHPAISMHGDSVSTCFREDTKKLHNALLKIATRSDNADWSELSTGFGLRHRGSNVILPVVVAPVSGLLQGFETTGQFARAVMCFSDPEKPVDFESGVLTDIYGLTPAEARVSISLANGLTPETVATMGDVSLTTVRSQIRAIYKKLGVDHQTELVKLLLTGPFVRKSQESAP